MEGLPDIGSALIDSHPFFHWPVGTLQPGQVLHSPYQQTLHIGFPPPTEEDTLTICAVAPDGVRFCREGLTGATTPADVTPAVNRSNELQTRFAIPFYIDNAWPTGVWQIDLYFDKRESYRARVSIRTPTWSISTVRDYSSFAPPLPPYIEKMPFCWFRIAATASHARAWSPTARRGAF